MSDEEKAAKPPVREAEQWRGSGREQAPELEREERRLERLRLVTNSWPTADRFDDDVPPQSAA